MYITGEISEYIEEVYLPDNCFILLKINVKRVHLLQLELSMGLIAEAIAADKILGVKLTQIRIIGKSRQLFESSPFVPIRRYFSTESCPILGILYILPAVKTKTTSKFASMLFQLKHIMQNLDKVGQLALLTVE